MNETSTTVAGSLPAPEQGKEHRYRKALEAIATSPKVWTRDQMIDCAVEALTGSPSAPVAAPQERWQPIETALKDREVLLWEPNPDPTEDGIVYLGHYVDFEAVGGPPPGYHSGWFDTWDGHTELHPTHWMPLPAAPQGPEGARCTGDN